MRVLFMPGPAIGHAFPLVPLGWAFRAAGHEVVFVTAGDALAVARAGLPVLDAVPGRTTSDMQAQFIRDVPRLFEPIGADPIGEMEERKPYIVSAWDPFVDAHVALGEWVQPDLVVYDPIFAVGPVVAARLKVPAVAHSLGLARFTPDLLRELPGAVAMRRHGVTLPEGIRTVDIAPPSLVEGGPADISMRYVPYNGGGVLPEWLREPAARPRIAVTFGTLGGPDRFAAGIARVLAAAPGLDAEFVLAIGESAAPPDLPPNVRTTGWVPLNQLLRGCAAAIHHGGDGTTLTCAALGVRQLVLPGSPDELVTGELLRARGLAHVLGSVDELDAAAIGRLLTDAELGRVTGEVRAEIAALPSPAEVVPRLAAAA
ncbi:nucleotide disphospho-sugar-binding domain-containing protein [Micromonospora chalcea]|uniref:nucleotide disphospho-sugar-binding domain-containing protein n=1 Tax=Micromonospora chalcea TaxID=1874 RepID=UPI0004C2B813|nr:nucleotide disphospho-sugar-binding domain-containing protein [Micromonospora purpureochromogenes]